MNIGAIGEASIIKIATNMVTAASVQGAAEAMAIVHYSGIPLEKFLDALKQNASNSGTLDLKVPQIIAVRLQAAFFGQAHAQGYADRESDGPTL